MIHTHFQANLVVRMPDCCILQAPADRLLQLLAQGAWELAFSYAQAQGLSADFVYRQRPAC